MAGRVAFEADDKVMSGWLKTLLLVLVLFSIGFIPVVVFALIGFVFAPAGWRGGFLFFVILAAFFLFFLAFLFLMASRKRPDRPSEYLIDGDMLIIGGSGMHGISYDIRRFSRVEITSMRDASRSYLSDAALKVVDYTGLLSPILVPWYAHPLTAFFNVWRDMIDREMVIISFKDGRSRGLALLPKDKRGFVEALRQRMK